MKIDGRTIDHRTAEHLRLTAIQLYEEGQRPSNIMAAMGLCRTTIYKWIATYRKEGLDGLASTKATGRLPKLTDKQKQQVKRWIVGKDPRQYGFDFGLWTRQIVAKLIETKMGILLSVSSVGKLLASLEITPQKPLRRAYERDPEAITKWVTETYPQIRREATRAGAAIFFLDEAGVRSDDPLGRTWGLKGHRPEVATSGQRQSVNAISAVTSQGAFWYDVYQGRFNGEKFVELLKRFMKGRRRVILILDQHPVHKAKQVLDYIESTKGRLTMHYLPGYAPEINPDEYVWSHLKAQGPRKTPLKQGESLKEQVITILEAIKANFQLVRSFFGAPHVKYAQ